MRVPMRVDYGVRALVELAMRYGDGPVQTAAIAYRQGIPEPYLERLMSTLNKSGFVHSRRGPQGGHLLARHPQTVNLYDIMQELDGNSSPLDCLTLPTDCMFADSCAQKGNLAIGGGIHPAGAGSDYPGHLAERQSALIAEGDQRQALPDPVPAGSAQRSLPVP